MASPNETDVDIEMAQPHYDEPSNADGEEVASSRRRSQEEREVVQDLEELSNSEVPKYLHIRTVDGEVVKISNDVHPARKLEGTRVDFVLIHPADDDKEKHRVFREQFENALQSKGVLIKRMTSDDDKTMFTLLHIPYERMSIVAERLKLKLPLKNEQQTHKTTRNDNAGWVDWIYGKLAFFKTGVPLEDDSLEYYAGKYTKANEAKFKGFSEENPSDIFSDAQKTLIANDLVYRTGKSGFQQLVKRKVYTSGFPLHTGEYNYDEDEARKDPDAEINLRAVLYKTWARFSNFYKYQPIHLIRKYFGEKVAIYFAWLGLYVHWLIYPSILGLICLIYGLGTFHNVSYTDTACDSTLKLCSVTDEEISYANLPVLGDDCNGIRASTVFDNGFTVAFSIFMSFWAVFFLESWKRRSAVLAFKWDTQALEKSELNRVEYYGIEQRENPITGKKEFHYPKSRRLLKYFGSYTVIMLLVASVIIAIIAVIIYRLAVRASLYDDESDSEGTSSLVSSVTGAILNLIAIIILGFFYRKLAVILNDWENHRTRTMYEDKLILKMFCFEFVNSYASLFYIAFFKGKFAGTPLSPNKFVGYRAESCPAYGCMTELTIQLAVILLGKQIFSNLVEIFIPYLMYKWKTYRLEKAGFMEYQWERDNALSAYPGIFSEYLEMILQFGYVTLFVSAFPVAPVFALLNNIFEIRIDATKFLTSVRRPPAIRAEDIGTWYFLLEFVAYVSVLTNGAVIAFTSNFIPLMVWKDDNNASGDFYVGKYAYSTDNPGGTATQSSYSDCYYVGYRNEYGHKTKFFYEVLSAQFAFFLIFVAVIFIVQRIIAYTIPDIPSHIRLAIRKQDYEAEQALESHLLEDDDDDDEIVVNVQAENGKVKTA
eukprot:Nk52_evm3s495 gene=Nk52_evmTU3s495